MRPLSHIDLDDFARLYGDPEVMQFIGSGAVNKERANAIVQAATDNWDRHRFGPWALILKDSNEFIGRCGLYYLDNTSDIQVGYALTKEYWGKGLAREAAAASLWYGFSYLGLECIYARVRIGNTRSTALAERLYMSFCRNVQDGNHKDAIYQIDKLTFLNRSRHLFLACGIEWQPALTEIS